MGKEERKSFMDESRFYELSENLRGQAKHMLIGLIIGIIFGFVTISMSGSAEAGTVLAGCFIFGILFMFVPFTWKILPFGYTLIGAIIKLGICMMFGWLIGGISLIYTIIMYFVYKKKLAKNDLKSEYDSVNREYEETMED